MVFSALSKCSNNNNNNNNNNEGWGLGLFFIFFHIHKPYFDHHHFNNNNNITTTTTTNNTCTRKRNSSFYSSTTSNLLLSKTQSTLTICALLVFTSLLLFTLSTFQPSSSTFLLPNRSNTTTLSRRFLRVQANAYKGFSKKKALQGLGDVYLRGSKLMSDVIVGHVSEDISDKQVVSFVRLVMFSGVLSKVDLVLVFASPTLSAKLGGVVKSECDSLLRIVQLGAQLGVGELGTGLTRYLRGVGGGGKEPIWGRRGNLTSVGESTRPSYGSVVGFDSAELDPEGSLSGFLDHVPMSLRRWACYPMLLGRVRRNFKHVMLVDVSNTLILSDPFTRVRNRSSESVLVWSNSVVGGESSRHRKGNSVNPGVIVGGSRGVRRFANAALTEIVRASVENKGRNSVNELRLVNKLVHSGHLLKSIHLVAPAEPILDSDMLGRFNPTETRLLENGNNVSVVVQRGESGVGGSFDLNDAVMKEICLSHKLFVNVYKDCLDRQQ